MRMPTSLPFASVTGTPEILYFSITCSASVMVCHGRMVTGIDDHPRFRALHLVDFLGLRVDRHVLVDDAEAALLGHGDGEPRLGDGVHGRRR